MPSVASILVVDDEEMNRDMCSRRLQRSGFSASVAASGSEALQMLEGTRYDLVLLDQMMPEMCGLEVLKVLRQKYSASELPVIMVTAVTEGSRIAEALDLGANDYVTKPVDFTVALARIRSQLLRTEVHGAIQRSEERYALAARGSNEGLWDWDLIRNEIYFSPSWKSLVGYGEDELQTSPQVWLSRVHPQDRERFQFAIQEHLSGRTPTLQCEFRIRHRDETYRWVSVRGVAVRSADGSPTRMVGSQSDVTEKSTVDVLTKLPNRFSFVDRLSQAFEQAQTEPSKQFAVLHVNIDRFKLVNDSLGDTLGDRLLASIAQRLQAFALSGEQQGLAQNIFLARLGSDEFALLLRHVSNQEGAKSMARLVCDSLTSPFQIENQDIYCSASVGVAMYHSRYLSAEKILRDAGTAMHAAKESGNGSWVMFEPEMRVLQQSRLQLDSDLRKAVDRSEFEVYYQPRVLLETGSICGFEALVRWNHPTRGLVSPGEFIPAAEKNGLIHPIGLWVLREACHQVHLWNLQFPQAVPLDVAVNLSARQCHEPGLIEQVAGVLEETGLPASQLNLELTESLLLDDMDGARRVLNALKDLGVGLKIDDFGTGYSCLKYLTELPFDTLKIDRSFVFDLDSNSPDSIEIVRTILLMAQGLRMGVIAEGIERAEHVSCLKELGCKFGQGFYFSKPMSVASTTELLEQREALKEIASANPEQGKPQ
jgi:diguanylate cyclase (GGDEF)-like protein/PAS domain S-box-containing protein